MTGPTHRQYGYIIKELYFLEKESGLKLFRLKLHLMRLTLYVVRVIRVDICYSLSIYVAISMKAGDNVDFIGSSL